VRLEDELPVTKPSFGSVVVGVRSLDLHLQRAGDKWTVVRTDEMTLSEFHTASP
jgi:hypothetical protein